MRTFFPLIFVCMYFLTLLGVGFIFFVLDSVSFSFPLFLKCECIFVSGHVFACFWIINNFLCHLSWIIFSIAFKSNKSEYSYGMEQPIRFRYFHSASTLHSCSYWKTENKRVIPCTRTAVSDTWGQLHRAKTLESARNVGERWPLIQLPTRITYA